MQRCHDSNLKLEMENMKILIFGVLKLKRMKHHNTDLFLNFLITKRVLVFLMIELGLGIEGILNTNQCYGEHND